jgi:3-isopropylmalate/(R)-2-methylmalate dehydratase large subunit
MTAAATLTEKIIARAAGKPRVAPGEIVMAEVDLAFAHDSSGPRRWAPLLREMGAPILHPERVAIVSDHYVPAADAESAAILKMTRGFAREHGIANFFDAVGICHTVLPEHGLIRPGAFIAGGDSHTPTAGAFGAFAAGYGATDMAAILATGETWIVVPATLRLEFEGRLAHGVTAKDVMLMLARKLGMDNAFKVVEFAGPAIAAMSMGERMVLCNMSAELGADTGVIAPDATTFAHLAAAGKPVEDTAAALSLASDAEAAFDRRVRFSAGDLEPHIAAPHAPENSGPVSEHAGLGIDIAYIGACVGAKLGDLRMAADVLRGRRIASGVRLIVAPASTSITRLAAAEGTLGILLEAGATLLASGCGACAGYGGGVLAEGEVCISTTNRNFRGRMGDRGSYVYLGSPYSVAAAAVTGRIIDPRALLGDVRATKHPSSAV